MRSNCPYCGRSKFGRPIFTTESTYGLLGEFEYRPCLSCRALLVMNTPSEPGNFYPGSYVPYSRGTSWRGLLLDQISYRFTGRLSQFLRRRFAIFGAPNLVSMISELKLPYTARILDYGCGSGALMKRLEGLGFKNVSGFDPYSIRGPSATEGAIFKSLAEIESGKYDLIIMNHVIEHLADPRQTVEFLVERMSANSSFIIRCPNARSFAWRRFCKNWVQLDAPRHLSIPSPLSISKMATDLDLDARAIWFDGSEFQIVGSLDLARGISLVSPRSSYSGSYLRKLILLLKKAFFGPTIWRLNRRGLSDQMAFILSKRQR